MINIDRTNPDVSFDMEVLCTIPCEPRYVLIELLRKDFDCIHQAEIQSAFDRIGLNRKIRIVTSNAPHGEGRCASVAARCWFDALGVCEKYWHKIHDGEKSNVL